MSVAAQVTANGVRDVVGSDGCVDELFDATEELAGFGLDTLDTLDDKGVVSCDSRVCVSACVAGRLGAIARQSNRWLEERGRFVGQAGLI